MKADELFKSGFNCAQAVTCAFSEILSLSQEELFKLSYGFGGGFAREREVCGAVSGMVIVADMIFAPNDVNQEEKKEYYAFVRELIEEFREMAGAIRCAELLETEEKGGNPEERNSEYYKKRPCANLCSIAEEILTRKIKELKNE